MYDGDVDDVLVGLIAENWEKLYAHFGETVFERLTGRFDRGRRSSDEQRRHVVSALATAAAQHPAAAEVVRHEAETDAALRTDRHFLLWARIENEGNEEALRAIVSKLRETGFGGKIPVLDAVLDRESWNVSDEEFKDALTEKMAKEEKRRIYTPGILAAYTQLFPADALSIDALHSLEFWFQSDRRARESRAWVDTLAIAFGVPAAEDLPVIVSRVHMRMRMGLSDLYLPLLTKPLMRRVRMDPDVVEAFRAALSDPMGIREDSPIFAVSGDPIADAHPDLQPLQRTYLFALILRQAGALPQQDAAATIRFLGATSPDTVVHNPFTNQEGPLHSAVLDLLASP
jgi:hypothetical protein